VAEEFFEGLRYYWGDVEPEGSPLEALARRYPLIVLTGLILSRWEDTDTTQGISRVENIMAIIVSGFIFYVGFEIARDILTRGAVELTKVPVVAVASLATIAISYFMARYQITVGRETNSPSLIATGTHARVDMYSSIVVVIALVGYLFGLHHLDQITAVIIVVLILFNGWEVFSTAVKALRQRKSTHAL